jgi:olfactory receptor
MLVLSGTIQVFNIVTVDVSYTLVLFIILKMYIRGIRKVFSTYRAHLLSVFILWSPYFHACAPCISISRSSGMMNSLFYTIIIPLWNPTIYNLRNKQVINSLVKIYCREMYKYQSIILHFVWNSYRIFQLDLYLGNFQNL